MFQPDLFAKAAPAGEHEIQREIAREISRVSDRRISVSQHGSRSRTVSREDLDLPAVLERIADISLRPRYTFMVLNLIARAAGQSDSAGPYIRENGRAIPIRDWLSNALLPMAQRDARRLSVVAQVRASLEDRDQLPCDARLAEQVIAEEVRARLRHSGRTNVSRAVSDLVRAGLVRRHYQGFRVDHENRGAQREAVYTITSVVKRALGRVG